VGELLVNLTHKDTVMDTPNGSPGTGSANDAARHVKDSATSIAESAKEAVARGAESGAQRVAGSAQDLASALRGAANSVQDDNAWVGSVLHKSADGIQRATRSLSSGDFSGVLHDVNGFARRQPAIFLGACVALGFAAARVGKTAIEQQTAPATTDGMGEI
jgi:hypothetical protein